GPRLPFLPLPRSSPRLPIATSPTRNGLCNLPATFPMFEFHVGYHTTIVSPEIRVTIRSWRKRGAEPPFPAETEKPGRLGAPGFPCRTDLFAGSVPCLILLVEAVEGTHRLARHLGIEIGDSRRAR